MSQLSEGHRDGFLEKIIAVNETILASCEKQKIDEVVYNFNVKKLKSREGSLLPGREELYSNQCTLFNLDGCPNYALPRHLLYMLGLYKIRLESHGIASVYPQRLKKRVYQLLMNYSQIDPDIIEFLLVIFGEEPSRINAVVRPGFITREEQMRMVERLSKEFDLGAFVMKTFIKMVTVDKSVDEEYFTQFKD